MNYPVVIFDFDGTLANSFDPTLDYVFDELVPKSPALKKIFTRSQIYVYQTMSIPELVRQLPAGWFRFIPTLLKIKKWHDQNLHLVSLYPEIPDLIRSLAENGYSMMILTSNSVANVYRILKRYNLDQYFIQIEATKGLFNKAKSLRKLFRKYNLQIQDAIYVGDEIRDVQACKKINLPVIAVSYGFNSAKGLQKYQPDYLVDTPLEILPIVDVIHDLTHN